MATSTFTNDPPPCPFCDAASCYLGTLGHRAWWRCSGCGLDHDVEVMGDPPADDPWEGCEDW